MEKEEEKKVVIGGTFETLHPGHKALLKRAFKLGRVSIGLTSDAFAKKLKKRRVKEFKERRKELKNLIKRERKALSEIIKIEDKFGFTLIKDFDYIVVSPETHGAALLINKERRRAGKKPIKIIRIKFVLNEDGKPFSSTAELARYKKNPDRQDIEKEK